MRILDVESVWNHTVYEVWIPRLGKVERVRAEALAPASRQEPTPRRRQASTASHTPFVQPE